MEFKALMDELETFFDSAGAFHVEFDGIGGQVDDCGKQGGADESKGCVLIRGCGGRWLGRWSWRL